MRIKSVKKGVPWVFGLWRAQPGRSRRAQNGSRIGQRAWCPERVSGRNRDRPHRKKEGQQEQRTLESAFGHGLLGLESGG